ncbi:MAG: hypothetical protein IPN68_00825 [Bacteroidetes bacterium]|nr:hypothetical protein [Bacteroidota bacterium]
MIETGLYKYIRHPGYLGQLIIFSWHSNFLIQLVIRSVNDDPCDGWIPQSHQSRRKIYDPTNGTEIY